MRPPFQAVGALRAAVRAPSLRTSSAATSLARPSSSSRAAVTLQPITRPFTTTTLTLAAPPSTSSKDSSEDIPKGPIRDEAIVETARFVRLVDPKTGSLAGPFPTKQILSKLDRTKFFLQQVAPPQASRSTVSYNPSSPPGSVDVAALIQFPICRLIDKKEEFDRVRNLKRKSTSPDTPTPPPVSGGSKEVQLTWSVSPNDLTHKLSKARKEMVKGARINVVVTTKAGGRKYIKGLNPKEDERREGLLREIEEYLCKPDEKADEKIEEKKEGEGEEGEQKDAGRVRPIARRLKEVDWQRGGSAAVMSFECFRR